MALTSAQRMFMFAFGEESQMLIPTRCCFLDRTEILVSDAYSCCSRSFLTACRDKLYISLSLAVRTSTPVFMYHLPAPTV